MSKEEFLDRLKKMGLTKEMLEYPAITERVTEVSESTEPNETFLIMPSEDHSSIIVGNNLKGESWSSKMIISKDGRSYTSAYSEHTRGSNWSEKREEVKIDEHGLLKSANVVTESYGPLDGGLSYTEEYKAEEGLFGEYVDYGFTSLKDMRTFGTPVKKSSYRSKETSISEIMKAYDIHAEHISSKYPELKEYYEKKRGSVERKAIIYSLIHGDESTIKLTEDDTKKLTETEVELVKRVKELMARQKSIRENNEERDERDDF